MYDSVLIADVYQRLKDAKQNHYEVDLDREAEGLSMLLRPFGRRNRRVAIVPEDNSEALDAYRRAGFSIRSMNGNRPTEIISFLSEESRNLRNTPPKRLIVMTTDPAFDILCSSAQSQQTEVSVWAPSGEVPPQLTHPDYDFRQLDELLPETKIKVSTVGVYLDYENLHIGLQKQGLSTEPERIIEAVRAETADLGNIADIYAYADWHKLTDGGQDIPYKLAKLGVKPIYSVGVPGKSSADMVMANDIRTAVDRGPSASDAVDTVVLGTRDSDFSTIVETAKGRNKKVVILAMVEGLSSKLSRLAEVRYLEKHFDDPRTATTKATETEFAYLMHIADYLNKHRFHFAFVDKVLSEIITVANGYQQLQDMEKGGMIQFDENNNQKLRLNLNHPDAYVAWWLTGRIRYCLTSKKNMSYVDTNYLVNGMSKDTKLQTFGIGQYWRGAKAVLKRAEATSVIRMIPHPHYKDTHKKVNAWWLRDLQPVTENENPEVTELLTEDIQNDTPEETVGEEITLQKNVLEHQEAANKVTSLAF